MKSQLLIAAVTALLLSSCDTEVDRSHLAPESSPDLIIVGLSPDYSQTQGERVLVSLANLLVRAKLGTTVVVVDALHNQRVAEFAIPADEDKLVSEKARSQHFAGQLLKLRQFIGNNGGSGEGAAAVHIPRFLEMVTQISSRGSGTTAVVLVGSALHQDPDGDWSFDGVLYPGDGVLGATPLETPYGTVGKESFLSGINLHFVCLDRWESDAYRLAVHRFWHLYCKRQQDEAVGLITFTSDVEEGMQRLMSPGLTPVWSFELDEKATAREMVRLPDRLPDIPEAVVVSDEPARPGKVSRVGLRWQEPVDLDLYVRTPAGDEIFFDRRRTPTAYFFKDERGAHPASRGMEYVVFEAPVAPEELQIWVNFYRGSSKSFPEAELLFETDGTWRSSNVVVKALHGNRGADRTSDRSSNYWAGPMSGLSDSSHAD